MKNSVINTINAKKHNKIRQNRDKKEITENFEKGIQVKYNEIKLIYYEKKTITKSGILWFIVVKNRTLYNSVYYHRLKRILREALIKEIKLIQNDQSNVYIVLIYERAISKSKTIHSFATISNIIKLLINQISKIK